MLVITRKVDEAIVIDGDIRVIVTQIDTRQGKVRLAIEAPIEVRVDREEIHRLRLERAGTKEG